MQVTGVEVFALREPVPTNNRKWWSTTPLDVLYDASTSRLARRQPGAEHGDPVTNVIVVVHSEDGRYGLGTVGVGSPVSIAVIAHHLEALVVGTDVFDTERTWQTMYRNTLALGRKGIVLESISAIDIALWDLKAKILHQPVYNLLGGRVKDRVRAYASELYARADLESLHREAKAHVAAGFTAVKMRFGYGPADGRPGMRANRELVRTVREAVGDDVDIAAEAYMGWDVPYAISMINQLDDQGLAWIEEPVLPDHLGSYAYIRNRVGTPISGGEHEFTLTGFRDMLKAGAVDILQPDVNRMGGITEAAKVWSLAEAYNVPVIPHSNQMHNAHLVVSSYSSALIEVFPEPGVEAGYNFYHQFFLGEPRAHGGYVTLGGRPGLGIELAPDVIREHLAERHVYGIVERDLLTEKVLA